METTTSTLDAPFHSPTDEEIVDRVRSGETGLFEILMRRHNQRVYRVARAVVKDESEAEDVMQQAYLNAFAHLGQFERRARCTRRWRGAASGRARRRSPRSMRAPTGKRWIR